MSRVREVTPKVLQILKNCPDARSNDRRLIEILYGEYYGVWYDPFYKVLQRNDLPSFESIRRARQKIQETNMELRGDAESEKIRMALQEEYIAYARGEES